MKTHFPFVAGIVAAGLCLLCACKREERGYRVDAPAASSIQTLRMSPIQAGLSNQQVQAVLTRGSSTTATAQVTSKVAGTSPHPVKNEYEENAYAMAQGKTLFSSFNCSGCHAHGGGAIGPPLMDDKWIYGSSPENVFATIVQGRPNGMPSFGGKIPDYMVWQLVAYVRSMSGLASKDAAPGRNDDMQQGQPENSRKTESPKDSSTPPSVTSSQ